MSHFESLIQDTANPAFTEDLQDRVDIIRHKIKFIEKTPFTFLDEDNNQVECTPVLADILGVENAEPQNAKVIIYTQRNVSDLQLMGALPSLLMADWPAVLYNRVYIWKSPFDPGDSIEDVVSKLEDVAEMLYPGFFIFGNEGDKWLNFKTQ